MKKSKAAKVRSYKEINKIARGIKSRGRTFARSASKGL